MSARPANPSTPRVTFWGAARTVTGSMHLLEAGRRRVLLDCGLHRGPHAEAHPQHHFPFDPAALDAVILSHAHTDHCGNLSALVRHGYDGPIYCTAPTRDLTALMLADSARIQEEKALTAVISGQAAGSAVPFTRADADRAIDQCVAVEYGTTTCLGDDIEFRLDDAGHLLGSAMVHVRLAAAPRDLSVTFTGDLGRRALPLHGPPAPVPAADLLICESTYGGRRHDSVERTTELLAEIVRRTVEREGRVLIPAFSLGRTQLVLHVLLTAVRRGMAPAVPVFVDSPLAADITAVYRDFPQHLPAEAAADPQAFLGGPDVTYVRTRDESMELSARPEPCVVIAAGGMCEGGRILHHLKDHIDDPRASIVLVSFQAPLTVGARLLERGPTVFFRGRTWNKWAEVYELSGFSGHADQDDFVALLAPAVGATRRVRLVHGEPAQSAALAEVLTGIGFQEVGVPERGEAAALGD